MWSTTGRPHFSVWAFGFEICSYSYLIISGLLKIKLEVAVDKLVNTECGHVTEHVPSQYTACSCHEPLDGMGSGTDH